MALDAADYADAYNWTFNTRLYAASRALQLVTRPEPGQYMSAQKLRVFVRSTAFGAGTDHADGADWATTVRNPTTVAGEYVDFETNHWNMWRTQVNLREQMGRGYTGLATVEKMAEDMANEVMVEIDKSIFADMIAGIPAANTFAMTGIVSSAGVETGDTAIDMLDFIIYRLEKDHVIGDSSKNPNQRAFVAVPPEIWRAIRKSFRENGGDMLAYESIYNGVRPVYDGKLAIIETDNLATRAAVTLDSRAAGLGNIANKTVHQCPFGVPEATFFGEREGVMQMFTPQNNPLRPAWNTNLLRIWGTDVIQSDRINLAYVAQS